MIAESSHYRVAFSVFVSVYPFCSVMCQTGEDGTVFPEVAALGALGAAVDLTCVWCLWCDNNWIQYWVSTFTCRSACHSWVITEINSQKSGTWESVIKYILVVILSALFWKAVHSIFFRKLLHSVAYPSVYLSYLFSDLVVENVIYTRFLNKRSLILVPPQFLIPCNPFWSLTSLLMLILFSHWLRKCAPVMFTNTYLVILTFCIDLKCARAVSCFLCRGLSTMFVC